MIRATSIGHAGILIETPDVSIVCDPWFTPAFFASWFVFPRNDQLSDDLRARIEAADFLYVSHLHNDHYDLRWLREHLPRDINVLLPGYPIKDLDRAMAALGFTNLIRTRDREEHDLGHGVTAAIHVEASIVDGPGGDSALVVSDGTSRLVNQNDCRTTDLAALAAHGPVDLHWLQFSGAIWYPMVYEMPPDEMARSIEKKVDSQLARAVRYVESVRPRLVAPSAGPPCFLDPDLFGFNVIDGGESIFVDQRVFIQRLADYGLAAQLTVPGTEFTVTPESIEVRQPAPDDEIEAIFTDKRAYLERYQADWMPWITAEKASWEPPHTDLVATMREWFEPLLAVAPTLRDGVGGACLLDLGSAQILIDFPAGTVRAYDGEPYSFRFEIDRRLVETVVANRAHDWSNSLFLSCRFHAWREGEYNEWVYNFFKSLSPERMRRTEAEAVRRLDPPTSDEPDVRLGDYVVQRRCPHRNADLAVFGELEDDCTMLCTLHGWRFDLETGTCLTSKGHPLQVRKATDADRPDDGINDVADAAAATGEGSPTRRV